MYLRHLAEEWNQPDLLKRWHFRGWLCGYAVAKADGEESPGFRAGVVAHIPEELRNREFPVYGEYEGDLLKRITIEIANNN